MITRLAQACFNKKIAVACLLLASIALVACMLYPVLRANILISEIRNKGGEVLIITNRSGLSQIVPQSIYLPGVDEVWGASLYGMPEPLALSALETFEDLQFLSVDISSRTTERKMLKSILPNLRTLYIYNNSYSTPSYQYLEQYGSLEFLLLEGSEIGNEFWSHLVNLNQLGKLVVRESPQSTGDKLSLLASNPNLRHLILRNTSIKKHQVIANLPNRISVLIMDDDAHSTSDCGRPTMARRRVPLAFCQCLENGTGK